MPKEKFVIELDNEMNHRLSQLLDIYNEGLHPSIQLSVTDYLTNLVETAIIRKWLDNEETESMDEGWVEHLHWSPQDFFPEEDLEEFIL